MYNAHADDALYAASVILLDGHTRPGELEATDGRAISKTRVISSAGFVIFGRAQQSDRHCPQGTTPETSRKPSTSNRLAAFSARPPACLLAPALGGQTQATVKPPAKAPNPRTAGGGSDTSTLTLRGRKRKL